MSLLPEVDLYGLLCGLTNNHQHWYKNNPLLGNHQKPLNRPFAETVFHLYNCEDRWHNLCCIEIAPRLTTPWAAFWLTRFLARGPIVTLIEWLMPTPIAERKRKIMNGFRWGCVTLFVFWILSWENIKESSQGISPSFQVSN